MNDIDIKEIHKVKKMKTIEIYKLMDGHKSSRWQYIVGMAELQRRNERIPKIIAYLAFLIAINSLAISLYSSFYGLSKPVHVILEPQQSKQEYKLPSKDLPSIKHQPRDEVDLKK